MQEAGQTHDDVRARHGMRVVLDTNVVLSVVVFRDERFHGLVRAWRARTVVPLVDDDCVAELARVLDYPQFARRCAGREAALAEYLPYTERVATAGQGAGLARCRDPDDQKFIVLAHVGRAEALVTSDAMLLGVRRRVGFAIETPKAFLARLDRHAAIGHAAAP
jgi:putative PIN family toxin of toxin-antitoxin system